MNDFGNKLLDLLRESVLVTSLLALLLSGTACYLWATGREVPKEMLLTLSTVIAFFFGSKSQAQSQRIAAQMNEAMKVTALSDALNKGVTITMDAKKDC